MVNGIKLLLNKAFLQSNTNIFASLPRLLALAKHYTTPKHVSFLFPMSSWFQSFCAQCPINREMSICPSCPVFRLVQYPTTIFFLFPLHYTALMVPSTDPPSYSYYFRFPCLIPLLNSLEKNIQITRHLTQLSHRG